MPEISCPSIENVRKLKQNNIIMFTVNLKTITPILGGGVKNRCLDEVDIIRPPTIRGHLRLWWRALYGGKFNNVKDLKKEEYAIWGGMGDNRDMPHRSRVEITVRNVTENKEDKSDISLGDSAGYVLWPARGQKNKDGTYKVPPAPRYKEGIQFQLVVRCPADLETVIRNTVQAWILFGGYGSRTRRGLGALTVTQDAQLWLPAECTWEAISKLFREIDLKKNLTARHFPQLAYLDAWYSDPQKNSISCWHKAISWLRNFRQEAVSGKNQNQDCARCAGSQPNKPGRSNWPEPDKVRHLRNIKTGHIPRYNDKPVFPRAGFGLPIVSNPPRSDIEFGGPFEIIWYSKDGELQERLGSPLILKPLPLANGQFVPFALWMNRKYPDGKVGLQDKPKQTASFDKLLDPADPILYKYLSHKTLRDAFAAWLQDNGVQKL